LQGWLKTFKVCATYIEKILNIESSTDREVLFYDHLVLLLHQYGYFHIYQQDNSLGQGEGAKSSNV